MAQISNKLSDNKWGQLARTMNAPLQAPVGQDASHLTQEKQQKIMIQMEFDKTENDSNLKDVHYGTALNPFIKGEVNVNDPQIKKYIDEIAQNSKMSSDELDKFILQFEEQPVRITKDNAIIENYQIETLMGALIDEENYKLVEKICVQYKIQDVSEYNLERLTQQNLDKNNHEATALFSNYNQTYVLFESQKYLISKMNPYQMAIVFNNLKALRYLSIRLNNHLRLSLNAPDMLHGGLQIKESNQISNECWPLFVSINNENLQMLMFLWQDLGNVYNTSIGAGFGNLNSKISILLGQDSKLNKLGIKDYQNLIPRPMGPSSQLTKLKGNDNRSKLWDQMHLEAVVQVLANQKYYDGLKFILSCKATHGIYESMSIFSKLCFLRNFLKEKVDLYDIEIQDILKLKLSEKPYASLSPFVMTHVDLSSINDTQLKSHDKNLRMTAATNRWSTFTRMSLRNDPSAAKAFQKKFEKEQFQKIVNQCLKYLAQNQVHIEHAIDNIDADDLMKFKYEFKQFDQFVMKNLEQLIKISMKECYVSHRLAFKLYQKVGSIIEKQEQRRSQYQIMSFFKQLINDQAFKKNWFEYNQIIDSKLFYWAKIGQFELFVRAVYNYKINQLNRKQVVYNSNQRNTIAQYHFGMHEDHDQVSSDNSDVEIYGHKPKDADGNQQFDQGGNLKLKRANSLRNQDNDEFQHEYQLMDNLNPELGLFTKRSGTVVELTPLLIAIQYKHFDIVRFIVEKTSMDIRLSLALIVVDQDHRKQSAQNAKTAKQKGSQMYQKQINHCQLSTEELSYGLLVACENEDQDMLRYLWENFGTNFWTLDHLRCIMSQLIHQSQQSTNKWLQGISMIFQSEVTHQIVKSLGSKDRTNFIEENIGNPFSQHFDMETRKCLLQNFCQKPYAGSLLILLIEYFDELHSHKRLIAGQDEDVIIALGATVEEAEAQFKEIWNLCLKGIYPMEIQVLREQCQDRFDKLVHKLDKVGIQDPLVSHRNQAIKMIQLLKGSQGYRGIIEDQGQDDVETHNSFEEDENAQLYQGNSQNILNYKQVSNQQFNFEKALKKLPSVFNQFMKQLINGNTTQIEYLIQKYDIEVHDILEMRGFNFLCNNLVENFTMNMQKDFYVNTYNWNPLHFAIFYKKVNILETLQKLFSSKLDIIWATKMELADLHGGHEGVDPDPLKQTNQKIDPEIKELIEENQHLYGYILAILTMNLDCIDFLLHPDRVSCQLTTLKDILQLIKLCKIIKWASGVQFLVESEVAKNQFLIGPLQEKIDLVHYVMSSEFVTDLVPGSKADDDYLQQSKLVKALKYSFYQFPYISVVWILSEPLFEEDFQYRKYIYTIKSNFSEQCTELLDQINQAHDLTQTCKAYQKSIQSDSLEQEAALKEKIADSRASLGAERSHYSTLAGAKSDEAQMKTLEQELQDIRYKQKQNKMIFDLQDSIIAQIEGHNLRSHEDFQEICQQLVEENIFPREDLNRQSQNGQQKLDNENRFYEKSLSCFKEILVEENILYLQTLTGFQLSEDFKPEVIKQNSLEFECIDTQQLNCLHWIICARRDDLFNYVIDAYFKQAMSTKDCLESQILAQALCGPQAPLEQTGGEIAKRFFSVVDYTSDISEQADMFTFQIKGANADEKTLEWSTEEICQERRKNYQLRIQNLGLALIIISKNQKALKQLLKIDSTIFMNLSNTNEAFDDILDGAILCAIKQWNAGVNILLDQVEIAFCRANLVKRLVFVQKVFTVLKNYKNQNTQSSCEQLISIPKVHEYIRWQEQNKNLTAILGALIDKMFPEPDRQTLVKLAQNYQDSEHNSLIIKAKQIRTIENNEKRKTELQLENMKEELFNIEKQTFFDGIYSDTFQRIIQRQSKQGNLRYAGQRDRQQLEFIARKLIPNDKVDED